MQGKMSEKKSCEEKRKESMHKMGILILNQNYNSPRKLFQNAPNGIRARFSTFSRWKMPPDPPTEIGLRPILIHHNQQLGPFTSKFVPTGLAGILITQ